MNTYSVDPGGRVLWCLRRTIAAVRCVVFPDRRPVEVRVLQDRDLVLTEVFPSEEAALFWAREYGERLRLQGWRDAAVRRSPPSAA